MTRKFDLLAMWKYPHARYEEQIGLILEDLKQKRQCLKLVADEDGSREAQEEYSYFDRITTVRGDCSGIGNFPMEYMRDHSDLPMGGESSIQFTTHAKSEMYSLLDATLFREAGDPLRFSYFAADPLVAEFEDQVTILLRDYKTDNELLSPHAPEEPGAHDDACAMAALDCLGAAQGKIGDIFVI